MSDIQNTETNSLKHLYNIIVDDYYIKMKVVFSFIPRGSKCDSSWNYPFKFPFFYNRLYFITSVCWCKTFILTGTEFRLACSLRWASLGHTSLTYARFKGTLWLMNSRSLCYIYTCLKRDCLRTTLRIEHYLKCLFPYSTHTEQKANSHFYNTTPLMKTKPDLYKQTISNGELYELLF